MAIENDAITFDTEHDGENLFLERFLQKADAEKKLSEKKGSADDDHDDRDHEDPKDDEDSKDADELSEDDEKSEDEPEKVYADGEAYIKIKVGEEEHEVAIKDLQRLYGQEASITQKGMQLATKRKEVEAIEASHLAASGALLNYARQRWEPYSKIDFLALSRDERISQDQFQALRAEAEDRWNELKFLEQETGQFVQQLQTRQNAQMVESAKEAVKTLMDEESPYHIEGYNESVYDGIRQFAVDNGLDKNVVNSIVDPAAIKLLHMAKLYSEGQSSVKTVKVGKQVTKVVKTSRTMSSSQRQGKTADKKAIDRLRQTGDTEDAAAAFLARFESHGGVE